MTLNIGDLNNLHIDVLREIGNIGAGNAATALARLLDKKVDMDVPKVKILEFKEANEIMGAETIVVGILLNVSGDINASIMFLLEQQAAHTLVNILMGKSFDDKDEFTEIELSALKEIGNILTGSYISALSMLTNMKLTASIPDMAIDMAGAILSVPAIEFGKVGDTVLYIETEFSEGSTKVVGDFILVPDMNSYETLLRVLGVIC